MSKIAPAQSTILQKLVSPLKQAIGNSCLGDSLAVIALCGLVAEMAAVLLWEISVGPDRAHDEKAQRLLGGARSFEGAEQARRVEMLKVLGVIDSKTKGDFSVVRSARREYLHYLSKRHDTLEVDARKAFTAATNVMAFVLGVSFPRAGVIAFRPELMAYLKTKGAMEDKHAGS